MKAELVSTIGDRSFWLAELARPSDWPPERWFEPRIFSLLVVMDSATWSDVETAQMAHRALDHGARAVCAWGDDSDRTELAFDTDLISREAISGLGAALPVVMTASLGSESLPKAVWFFCNCSLPPDGLPEGECKDWLVFTVGAPQSAEQIRGWLRDPGGLFDLVR